MSSKILQKWTKTIGERLLISSWGHSRRKLLQAAKQRPTIKPMLEVMEDRITPSNFTVTDLTDDPSDTGSIRYAINNLAAGSNTIIFSTPSGTIDLTNGTLTIDQDVTITGPGSTSLAISGGGTTQVFNIAAGVTASISGLTIENGQAASGGGINNSGTLTLSDDAFNSNACTGFGGAVSNGTFGATATNLGATLTANNCTFTGNSAGSTAGGLFNFGTLALSNSTFTSNTAQWGPAVGNAGQCPGYNFNGVGLATVTGCTMTQNSNTALNSGGGGVDNLDGTLTLSNSTISNNTTYTGGGVNNNGGTLTLINDTITNNTATMNGGGISTLNYFGATAITTTTVTNCTITGNSATGYGGGIYSSDGSFYVSGSTISGNSGASFGGGIYNTATMTLSSSNVAGNTSMDGADINNAPSGTLIAGDTNAFTSATNINNDGTLNLSGSSNSIGTLTGGGTITNSLDTYQIDDNEIVAAFNNTIGTETTSDQAEDCWVGNVFTSTSGDTLQSISFYTGFAGPLNASTLSDPNITAALYTGSPGAGLTLVPGSVNTVALNADPSEWVTVPFASLQNVTAGQTFTAVLLIDDVPSSVYPFDEDASNDSSNSYYDIDNPVGNVNTYDLAAPNNPTPNGVTYPGQPDGATNAYVDTTIMRVNQTEATLTVTGGGNFSGSLQESGPQQDGGNFLALTVAGDSTTLILSGNNTYSGPTTIDSGDTLQAGSSTALTSNTSVTANGTIDLNGNSLSIYSLFGSASGVVIDSGSPAALTVTGGGNFPAISPARYRPHAHAQQPDPLGRQHLRRLDHHHFRRYLQAASTTAFSSNSGVSDNGTLDLGGFNISIDALTGSGVVIDSGAAATLTVTAAARSAAKSRMSAVPSP